MSGKVRVGILSAAHVHTGSYLAHLSHRVDVELVALVDPNETRAGPLAERYQIPWRAQVGALRDEVDAVLILSENSHHRRDFEVVARPGLLVLCEKPLATTREDGDAMLERAVATGARLYTALPVRTLQSVAAMRETVQAGRLGPVVAMHGTNHGSRPPGWFLDPLASGGGAVMDHVSHVVDLMRYIGGGEPEAVRCLAGSRLHALPVDDSGLLLMDWTGGVTATLDPSWSRLAGYPTWGDVTLEVVGEEGVARLDAFNAYVDRFGADHPPHRYLGYGEDMDGLLLDAFMEAARTGFQSPALATAEDGFRAAAVSWAAYRSVRSGHLERVAAPGGSP